MYKRQLPCWRITPSGDKRGTILFHGGNDSLLEEFTDLLLYLARGGYEILAFEGPGQGAALRKSGLTFTPEWEKPVGAVLDFYGAEAVSYTHLDVYKRQVLCMGASSLICTL